MSELERYLLEIRDSLKKYHYHPKVMKAGGHDWTHCLRMELMGEEFSEFLSFDQAEFIATVWLHNIDHASKLNPEACIRKATMRLLEQSPFSSEARDRIVDAVDEHWVRDDRPTDSGLRQALRLADKWDRFSANGILAGAAYFGGKLLPYIPEDPFGYDPGNGLAGYEQSLSGNFFKILEWYRDFPLIRELVRRHPKRMESFLAYVRAWAEEVSETHQVQNRVEEDIAKALGDFYSEWE